MACNRRRQGVVGPPRQVKAFRPEVVQHGGGQRQDLNVQSGFVHQSKPVFGKIEQALSDRAGMKRDARVYRPQGNRIPRVMYLGCDEMLFNTNQLHDRPRTLWPRSAMPLRLRNGGTVWLSFSGLGSFSMAAWKYCTRRTRCIL